MKGLVDTENISHNASDYDQHLSSASPTIPPSDNETIEFGNNIRRRLHNHHHHLIERRSSMIDKFEENESDLMHRDDLDVSDRIANRAELSPILSGGDQSRKRRKDSICDNPLPQKRLHRFPSESHVSTTPLDPLFYFLLLLRIISCLTTDKISEKRSKFTF